MTSAWFARQDLQTGGVRGCSLEGAIRAPRLQCWIRFQSSLDASLVMQLCLHIPCTPAERVPAPGGGLGTRPRHPLKTGTPALASARLPAQDLISVRPLLLGACIKRCAPPPRKAVLALLLDGEGLAPGLEGTLVSCCDGLVT